MRVLLVEDEPDMASALRAALTRHDMIVDHAPDLSEAEAMAALGSYDALVLDRQLPDGDGLGLIPRLRARGNLVPVLVLTARGDLADRVAGLDRGADDYLAKPFEPDELVARLRAVTRRRSGKTSNVLSVGKLSFNTDTKELHSGSARLALSPRELALLELLMSSPGAAVPKSRIVSAMSSWESNFSANSVEIYVLKLRRKLAEAGVNIVTVRGVGYALETLAAP